MDSVYHPKGAAAGNVVATRFGTFVDDVHAFDAAAFGLSPIEAQVRVVAAARLIGVWRYYREAHGEGAACLPQSSLMQPCCACF